MATRQEALDKELQELDKLQSAAWKAHEASKNEADSVRFLQVILEVIHKRCDLLKLNLDPSQFGSDQP